MSSPTTGYLALRDRAYAFLRAHGPTPEQTLVEHVFGAAAPPALVPRLVEPLRGDPRLARDAAGDWSIVSSSSRAEASSAPESLNPAATALVVVATGPSPRRARIVHLVAVDVESGGRGGRFAVTVHPGIRVPDYVMRRLGVDREVLNEQPPFADVLDAFLDFIGNRPLIIQDAQIAWDFIDAEARRLQRTLVRPHLIDANDTAMRGLDLRDKPTLAMVAAHLGVATGRLSHPDEEARVLALVAPRLLAIAADGGVAQATPETVALLRSNAGVAGLPSTPGVYVLRDRDEQVVYVGKARRLRDRVGAYVHRPLGATRRLEGLVGNVSALDRLDCDTDLDALVLEQREIGRLLPRFNVARQTRRPRLWIRLPPPPVARKRGRSPAPRRLEPSEGPAMADGAFVGPFVNETAAESVRALARSVFDLDRLRHLRADTYEQALSDAWAFLRGERQRAEDLARQRSLGLLRQVLACDPEALLLPADPLMTRYAVVRPTEAGAEAFVLDRGIFTAWEIVDADADLCEVATRLVRTRQERTHPDDVPVVVRWLGAQRPPAHLIALPSDEQAALDVLADALASALAARAGEA